MNKKIIFSLVLLVFLLVSMSYLRGQKPVTEFAVGTRGLTESETSQIVELKDGDTYEITAGFVKKNINGNVVRMLAYNGSIPGPTIKIAQGSTITINFNNDTDIPNTIHSHGVRMENAYDGVPNVTQKAVPVGGTFQYKLSFSDAGMYWYHPHVRDDYAIELGLYGNFWVTPNKGSSWNKVDREVPLFVDDILMSNNRIAPFKKEGASHTLMGRFGNTMLLNGETDYKLSVKKGEVVRFYFTNSSNTRLFNLAFSGMKLKLVGGDSGLYERDSWQDSVIVSPSERAIVEVLFDRSGNFTLQNKTPEKIYTLGSIIVSDESIVSSLISSYTTLRSHSETIQSINPFRAFFSKSPDKYMKLSVGMMGDISAHGGHSMASVMPSSAPELEVADGGVPPNGGIEWEDNGMMNSLSNTQSVAWKIIDEKTRDKNMDIKWTFTRGDKVKIRITNDPSSLHPMQHPIHFHGQRFLVLSKNGEKQTNLVWKDTVLVPAGEYVDILLDASNVGTWMAHCHIFEHMEAGMMMKFEVR